MSDEDPTFDDDEARFAAVAGGPEVEGDDGAEPGVEDSDGVNHGSACTPAGEDLGHP